MLRIVNGAFWVALTFFLMPHEPDVGLGRPASPASMDELITTTSMDATKTCPSKEPQCSHVLSAAEFGWASLSSRLQALKGDLSLAPTGSDPAKLRDE